VRAAERVICRAGLDVAAARVAVLQVYLHVPWSLACRHNYATFAELAGRYVTGGVRFASLNLGEWPHLSKRLGVDASGGNMTAMPAVVLYEKGVEVGWSWTASATRLTLLRDLGWLVVVVRGHTGPHSFIP
jgi:hypothetical protein